MGENVAELIETGECCPKCGRPIQIGICRLLGVEKRVRVMCQCELDRRQKERDAIDHRSRVSQIYSESGLTPRQRQATFEGWMKRDGAERAYSACTNYAENFRVSLQHRGIGMYLYGTTGSGKTRLIHAIANALIEKEVRVVCWNVPSLLGAIKGAYDGHGNAEDYLHAARHANLLILDDLGSEKPSEWTRNTLYELINSRIENVMPTIVTSNWEPSSPRLLSEDVLGARLMSRLNDREVFLPVLNKATDYRRERR